MRDLSGVVELTVLRAYISCADTICPPSPSASRIGRLVPVTVPGIKYVLCGDALETCGMWMLELPCPADGSFIELQIVLE